MEAPTINSFADYQNASAKTAVYPEEKSLEYLTLGLSSEAGEIAGKVKKIIRDDGGKMDWQKKEEITKECGDVLWYLSQLINSLGCELEGVAQDNVCKLYSRMERGKIKGSGDNR
jgi:NTP pyrophosphatase (non-canonical NTP hydrolase)|tara:strand:+ start:311 stop:655 length:345 start_codon:yes stop_codon:yes gene_type:complete